MGRVLFLLPQALFHMIFQFLIQNEGLRFPRRTPTFYFLSIFDPFHQIYHQLFDLLLSNRRSLLIIHIDLVLIDHHGQLINEPKPEKHSRFVHRLAFTIILVDNFPIAHPAHPFDNLEVGRVDGILRALLDCNLEPVGPSFVFVEVKES